MKGANSTGFARLLFVLAVSLVAASCGDEQPGPSSPIEVDPTFLDTSVDPCTDFFQYACGTWLAQHPAGPGYVNSRFYEGEYRNDIFFTDLIETPDTTGDADLQKAQTFYRSCRDLRSGAYASLDPLTAQLDSIQGMTGLADLPPVLAQLHATGIHALFASRVDADPGHPESRVVTLWDRGWSLPVKEDYEPGGGYDVTYPLHMKFLVEAARSSTSINLDPATVFAFEHAVAAATADPEVLDDPVNTYNPTPAAALATLVPGFDWPAYFAARGFPAVETVNLAEPAYLAALGSLLAATPVETLKQYLSWRVLEAEGGIASAALIEEEFRFHGEVVLGRASPPSDWWVCLNETRAHFGWTFAKHFVERFVPPQTRPAVTALTDDVHAAMQDVLAHVAWLDEPTRARAQQKLAALLAKVGYPDEWPGYSDLKLGTSGSFLGYWQDVQMQENRWTAAALTRPADRTIFAVSPDITNAFYSPLRNDISLPVAILEPPFFATGARPEIIYGALGSVIGHETTHGFDHGGRKFDGVGMLSDWWTDTVDGEFDRRAQCLAMQYSGYEAIPGQFVDGALTLDENIADLGGLKLAHAAFQAALRRRGGSATLAGFSPEQRFFLAQAQLFCADESPSWLSQSLLLDPHAPSKFRVNGVVRNVAAFAAAFNCPVGAPLAPAAEDRCELW